MIRKILKWVAISAVGILLFLWGKEAAFEWRGYEAIGGEYLLLLFPLLWWAVEGTIKDTREAWKDRRKGEDVEDGTDENGDGTL